MTYLYWQPYLNL